MDHFKYKNGVLFAEQVEVDRIIKEVGSPVYVYSQATFGDHITKIQEAYKDIDTTVCYAVKACGNIHILKLMAEAGSGFDIVSGGELYRVKKAGGDLSKVMFAGVGKTDREIVEALNADIGYFNIESLAELENLICLAKKHGKTAKAALRINPDVDYKTHAYITTGKKESKFGVDIKQAIDAFDHYAGNGALSLCGIHVHLGSGGNTIDPYVNAVKKILPVVDTLRSKGHTIETLDLGGGYGAEYESGTVPSSKDYAQGLVPLLKNKDLRLILEPGKSICANAGILLTQVLYSKEAGQKKFVIVDAAMNDLIRPALYQAFHFIWPTRVTPEFTPMRRTKSLLFENTEAVDVVGPVCESGDFLAQDWPMPPVIRGEALAVFTAGAYGFSMSSNYNARGRAAEVLVSGSEFKVISRRETYEDLIAREV